MTTSQHPTRMMHKCLLLSAAALLAACGSSTNSGDTTADTGGDTAVDVAADVAADVASDAVADAAPDAAPTERDDLVTVLDDTPVQLAGGVGGSISFEVPDDAVSIAVRVVSDSGDSFNLAEWVDGAGYDLVAAGWIQREQAPAMCTTCNVRVSGALSAFAALAPNNERGFFSPGTHEITVYGYRVSGFSFAPSDADATVSVVIKRAPAEPETGVLDLNLHFTGSGGWTADTAPDDAEFQAVLDGVRDIYSGVGLELGVINYFDIDPSYRVIEGLEEADDDLALLFAESAGNPQAVNVFFVDELISGGPFGGFGVVLGIAGGIPGPPLMQGTTRSGVAIAVESHNNPELGLNASLSTTMAHEVGHFLGLFHTSEVDFGFGQQLHDPIDDTPQNDATYLMFNTGEGNVLSPFQGRVMRLNPWVRHPETN